MLIEEAGRRAPRVPDDQSSIINHQSVISVCEIATAHYLGCPPSHGGTNALVAELADAYGSGPYGVTRGGSNPLESTTFQEARRVKRGERRRKEADKIKRGWDKISISAYGE